MNAPLPEHVRKALETVTLDENPQGGFSRRHNYSGGEADCAVFGDQRLCTGETA
jgi:hypothetical protein